MKEKLKSILRTVWSWRRWPYLLWLRRRVKNRRFLLIASDCNGGLLLHDLGMQFTMPTVNMAFRESLFENTGLCSTCEIRIQNYKIIVLCAELGKCLTIALSRCDFLYF